MKAGLIFDGDKPCRGDIAYHRVQPPANNAAAIDAEAPVHNFTVAKAALSRARYQRRRR